jgi:hypothetical protein
VSCFYLCQKLAVLTAHDRIFSTLNNQHGQVQIRRDLAFPIFYKALDVP